LPPLVAQYYRLVAVRDVVNSQINEITATQLAIDGRIEHGQVSNLMQILQMNSASPEVFRLEVRRLPDQLAFVPGFPCVCYFHADSFLVDRIVESNTGSSSRAWLLLVSSSSSQVSDTSCTEAMDLAVFDGVINHICHARWQTRRKDKWIQQDT
jgi:hypothetical protein